MVMRRSPLSIVSDYISFISELPQSKVISLISPWFDQEISATGLEQLKLALD
jgi:hypothetical protein